MKRFLCCALIAALMIAIAAPALADVPSLNSKMFTCAKAALACLAAGDYDRVVRLISMFANQLRIDAHIKFALEDGSYSPAVLKDLNVSKYRAQHILRQVRPFPAEALKERYLQCVETEYAIKSGKLRDRAALDMLMLKIVMPPPATKPGYATSNR